MSELKKYQIIDEENVEDFLEDFIERSRLSKTPEETRKRLEKRAKGDSQSLREIEAAYTRAKQELGFTDQRHQVGAYKRELQGKFWFKPDLKADTYWPPLRISIENDLGDAINEIDSTSTAVLNGLRPINKNQHSKGLVLGYVQSGKTTNFLSVIAKAADAGFRLIIVLTGITENLRQQTQDRIDQLIVNPMENRWTRLTDKESDFTGDRNASHLGKPDARFIAVVKKNSHRLHNLNNWINAAGDLGRSCPILVIDDEADQASIDVSPKSKNERSAINRQINNLLENDITAYIAYTATPFANILIDPSKADDLYPSDFIITLPEPKGYFGSRALFGREPLGNGELDLEDSESLDMIRIISDEEVEGIRPGGSKEPDKTIVGGDSLKAALRWFIMATAARRARGQQDKHSSMLIHTSMLTNDHEDLRFQVDHEMTLLKREIKHGSEKISEWRTQWDEETSRVPAENFNLSPLTFKDIEPLLKTVLDDTKRIVDNGESDERLSYQNGPKTVVVIGGNTLSRGLTLEGLISSYFVRRASAYDTLLQMGRWFGFRNGYQDLPRIWMPHELNNWFRDLSIVETELREELDVYIQELVSPMEIQAKIRLHPTMQVTSAAKMQSAVQRRASFNGSKQQTIRFKERDLQWLQGNINAVKNLFIEVKKRGIREQIGVYESPVFHNVPTELVLNFLDEYRIHEDTILGKEDNNKENAHMLKEYIRNENNSGRLPRWNISVIGKRGTDVKTIPLGLENESPLLTRRKLATSTVGEANIKALVTTTDRINDVIRDTAEDRAEFRSFVREETKMGHTEYTVRSLHSKHVGSGIGHLAIYPIACDKVASTIEDTITGSSKKENPRTQLDAVENVIGLGIFFPQSDSEESTIEWVSAPEPEQEFKDAYLAMSESVTNAIQEDEATDRQAGSDD